MYKSLRDGGVIVGVLFGYWWQAAGHVSVWRMTVLGGGASQY